MTDNLSKGVPYAERIRFLEDADPALTEDLQKKLEAHNRTAAAHRERTAEYQHRLGMAQRQVPSDEEKAYREIEARCERIINERIANRQIIFAGFPTGQLSAIPQPLPDIPGKWAKGRCQFTTRGVTFHDVKLYRVETIKALDAAREKAELDTETASGAKVIVTEMDCFDDLVEIFRGDPKNKSATPRVLLRLLTERNPAYGMVKESDTVKGWIRKQRDSAAKKATGAG